MVQWKCEHSPDMILFAGRFGANNVRINPSDQKLLQNLTQTRFRLLTLVEGSILSGC